MTRSPAPPHHAAATGAGPLEALRALVAPLRPLPALTPAAYAEGHDLFEARSDQRDLLVAWLRARLAARAGAPLRVLSVGCGDGTVDARVSAGADVARYDGVEPFAGSAAQWRTRMAGVPGQVQQCRFEDAVLTGPYDVVLAVHCLYYVPDVAAALQRMHGLLAPGGELLVLHAPRAELNALVEVLAPETGGHAQWFSDVVTGALRRSGLAYEESRLHARLDLTDADDRVLDFTVQAVLPPQVRAPVLAHLAAVRLPDAEGLCVPHPLDAFVVRGTSAAAG